MREIFNLRRFKLLATFHVREHHKPYLLGMGVLAGVWIVILAPATAQTMHYHEGVYRLHGMLFSFLFGTTGAWFASEVFRELSTPLRGIPYLMLPASQLEKFGIGLLVLLLYVPLFSGIFFGLEAISFAIINSRLPLAEPRYTLLNPFSDVIAADVRYLALLLPCLFLLGSLYFSSVPFVKTSIVALLLYFLIVVINDLLLGQLLPDTQQFSSIPFMELYVHQSGRQYNLPLTGPSKRLVDCLLTMIGPALWWIAYVRLKEKQF